MSNEKIKAELTEVELPKSQEIVGQDIGYMPLINKLSQNPTRETMEIIERMMTAQEKWEDRQAEKRFNEAMAAIAKELASVKIIKDSKVQYDVDKNDKSQGKVEAFRYVKLEKIEPIVRPILLARGMHVSYDTEPCALAGWHTIVVWFAHNEGHRRAYRMPMPLDSGGGKNNAQAMGSTQSYGMRRGLCAALNLIPVGEDDDASGAPITDEEAKIIKDGLKNSGLDVKKFLSNIKAESVEQIKSKDYGRAMTAIDAKLYRLSQQKKDGKDANPS